jgi:hypothetical protein
MRHSIQLFQACHVELRLPLTTESLVQIERRGYQRQVRKRLRRVAQLFAGTRDLLREYP